MMAENAEDWDGLSPEDAVRELAVIAKLYAADPEAGHVEADRVLCRVVRYFGRGDVVAAWDKVDRWYA